MPKVPLRISNWHGGLSSHSDPKDIGPAETPQIKNFDVSSVGQLKLLGGFANSASVNVAPTMSFVNGQNFFVHSTDFVWDNNGGAIETGEQWITLLDTSSGNVWSHASTQLGTTDAWSRPGFEYAKAANASLETIVSPYGGLPCMYYADGAVRIYNTAYNVASATTNTNSTSLWLGYIDRTYLGSAVTVDDWQLLPAEIVSPSVATFSNTWSIGTGSVADPTLANNAGLFNTKITVTREKGDGSLFMNGRVFYVSYTYDTAQESLPVILGDTITDLGIEYTDLPDVPDEPTATTASGDPTDYGDPTITVTDADDLLEWAEAGTFTATDTRGEIQTLQYGGKSGTSLTGVIGWVDTGVCSIDASTAVTPELCSESYECVGGTGADQAACELNGGTWTQGVWTYPTIAAGVILYYQVPGEPEEKDNELGFQIQLFASNVNTATVLAPRYGGNRITAVNFYTNKFKANSIGVVPEATDYAYVGSFDLSAGWNIQGTTEYNNWFQGTGASLLLSHCTSNYVGSLEMLNQTYMSRTGVFPDAMSIHARMKTAVVVNRRTYGGNVRMKDRSGTETIYPDRLIKSIPNSFDVFPTDDFIDAAVDDGEDIVKLEEFGGKLLQFKEETLYIINIAEPTEFLEGSHKYKGLDSTASSTKTSVGVCWCNQYGAYIFDGGAITDITLEKTGDWGTFYEVDMVVSFHPIEMKIFFLRQSDNRFRIYDIATKSFTEGDGNPRYGSTTVKSDVLMYDSEMHIAKKEADGLIYFLEWEKDWAVHENAAVATTVEWHSKDNDFEMPSADTKIYKVHITYKTDDTNDSNVALQLVHNDGAVIGTTDLVYRNDTAVSNLVGTDGEWLQAELKPVTSVSCKNAKVIIANVANTVINKSFKVNDMAIIHRNKTQR